jgi:uncharacterized protein (DUF433 family)
VIDCLRVTVRHVVTLHRLGETTLEIAEALGITEAQVFHALSYFFDHRDEILALIAQEEQAQAVRVHSSGGGFEAAQGGTGVADARRRLSEHQRGQED